MTMRLIRRILVEGEMGRELMSSSFLVALLALAFWMELRWECVVFMVKPRVLK